MKKRKKLIIIIIIISIILISLVITFISAYSRYLYPTGEVISGIYTIKVDNPYNNASMGNFFLISAGEKYIAIDTGADSKHSEIQLNRLGISPNDIIAVFITHSDWDHIGSLPLFTQATIYTSVTEFQYMNTARFTSLTTIPELPHIIINDGEIIELYCRTIKCIYTPGHTSDSVSFLVDDKYLFVGDLFINPNLARYDTELQVLHRNMVLDIDGVEYIFTGHFGLFKDVRFFRWWY